MLKEMRIAKERLMLTMLILLPIVRVGSERALTLQGWTVRDLEVGEGEVGSPCSSDSSCAPGLYCFRCLFATGGGSGLQARCTRHRATATSAFPKNTSLPFNRYAWLTTHNSFAIFGSPSQTGAPIVTFFNQEDSVLQQLANGVRGLMLDLYDFRDDIWLCHSFLGVCNDFTAFRPAILTLREIASFLESNPTEVVTIFIEDYVRTPNGIRELFRSAGLMPFWMPVTSMPRAMAVPSSPPNGTCNGTHTRTGPCNGTDTGPCNGTDIGTCNGTDTGTCNGTDTGSCNGTDAGTCTCHGNVKLPQWPTLGEMIQRNHRLLVFTQNASKEATEGVAYQWRYTTENQYGDGGMRAGECPKRSASAAMADRSRALVVQNFFPTDPDALGACVANSVALFAMLGTCFAASGERWANYLAVDFYKRSTGGGAFYALDFLNGQMQCSCQDVTQSCLC